MVEQGLKKGQGLFGREVHIVGKEYNVCERYGDMEKHNSIPVVILGFHLKYSAKSHTWDMTVHMLIYGVFLMNLYTTRNFLKR